MAEKSLPFYLITDYRPSTFTEFYSLLKDGVSVFHNGPIESERTKFSQDQGPVEYIYDDTNDCLHISSDPYNLFESVVSPSDMFPFKPIVRSRENLFNIKKVQQRQVIDYPEIINQLEKAEIVKTIPTKSIMAVDQRKFAFILPDVSDEPDYIDVDFLGTTLANELSQRVCDIYKKTFSKFE